MRTDQWWRCKKGRVRLWGSSKRLNGIRLFLPFFLSLSLLPVAQATEVTENYFKFLEKRTFHLAEALPSESVSASSDSVEWYHVKDQWGKSYSLVLKQYSKDAVALIQVHKMMTFLGIHAVPAYPLLLKRGMYGVPRLEEAHARWSQTHQYYEPQIKDDQWISAIISPANEIPKRDHIPYTPEVLLDLFKVGTTALVLGYSSLQLKYHHGHMVVCSTGKAFDYKPLLPGEMAELLANYLKTLPFEALDNLSVPQAEHWLKEVELHLSRLESMVGKHQEVLLHPLVEAAKALDKRHPWGDLVRTVRQRTASLRSGVERILRKKGGKHFQNVELSQASEFGLLVPPRVQLKTWAKTDIPDISESFYVRSHAKEILYRFYQSSRAQKEKMIQSWKTQLTFNEFWDPLDYLLELAGLYDTRMHVFSSSTFPLRPDTLRDTSVQFSLHRASPKSLVVYSKSDREGLAIEKLVAELKLLVPMEVMVADVGRRYGLSNTALESILTQGILTDSKRLIVCELNRLSEKQKQMVGEAGIELVELDHHNYAESDWKKSSAIEQLMDMYGYRANLEQISVAIMDRSGIFGFETLGLTARDLEAFLRQKKLWYRYQDWLEEYGAPRDWYEENVAIVRDYRFSINQAAGALGLSTFPKIPHIVTAFSGRDHFIRVLGHPEFIWQLVRYYKNAKNLYWGGDASKFMYLGVSFKSKTDLESALLELKNLYQSPHSRLQHPCLVELEKKSQD